VNFGRFSGVVWTTAEITAVCLFLATVPGLVSSIFTVETGVVSHKFCFLCFGVLLSSAFSGINVCGDCSVDIHMVSSLRGSTLVVLPVVVPSLVVALPISLLGREFEGLKESLTCLGELSCCLPFEMGFVGLFFPLLECPRGFCSRVKVGGINDGASESFGHSMLESFDGSLVI